MTQRTSQIGIPRIAVSAAALVFALGLFATPARADRCDDLARQLSQQIDGMKVGATRGGVIFLQHPAVVRASLGCSSRNNQGEFYAVSAQKKPLPEFTALVSSAAAQIFTIPKGDAARGVKRCYSRIGLIHGYDVQTRYRKLDIHCSRTNDGSSITVSREKE